MARRVPHRETEVVVTILIPSPLRGPIIDCLLQGFLSIEVSRHDDELDQLVIRTTEEGSLFIQGFVDEVNSRIQEELGGISLM